MDQMETLVDEIKQLGAFNAGTIAVDKIPFDPELRKACEVNYCGHYGKNCTCPPFIGEVEDLIKQAKEYKVALVYQTVSELEDSYDYEGMMAALEKHKEITDRVTQHIKEQIKSPILQLSIGGCPVCDTCAKVDDQPCRYPNKALASLEAYGVYVSKLAELCNMKYINGQNTVTYFGAYLFR